MSDPSPRIEVSTTALVLGPTEGAGSFAEKCYSVSAQNLPGSLIVNAANPVTVALAADGPFTSQLEIPSNDGHVPSTSIHVALPNGTHLEGDAEIIHMCTPAVIAVVRVSEKSIGHSHETEELLSRVQQVARAGRGLSDLITEIFARHVVPYVGAILVEKEIDHLVQDVLELVYDDFLELITKDPAAKERVAEAFPSGSFDENEARSFLLDVYPSMQAVLWYRVGHEVYRTKLIDDAGLRHEIALRRIYPEGRAKTKIDIDPRAQIGRCFVLDHGEATVIGRHVSIGSHCYILHSVNLGAGPPRSEQTVVDGSPTRHPIIGNNVKIFGYASILGGITIGDNCQIGTRTLVTESIPADSKVRIVNQYQIVRAAKASDKSPGAHIFGIVPIDGGKFRLYGEHFDLVRDITVVNESDISDIPIAIKNLSSTHEFIDCAVEIDAETRSAMRAIENRQVLRDKLIRARLKIAFQNGTALYLCQSEGLRRAIATALESRGFWSQKGDEHG